MIQRWLALTYYLRPLQNSFPPTAETQTQVFGCFYFKYPLILLKYPLNPPRIPDNQASGPPFRRQQAHLACWRLSKGSNTSPSDGFARSLCSARNRLPAHSGIYGAASRSSVRPHNGFSINTGYASFDFPSADGCGRLCASVSGRLRWALRIMPSNNRCSSRCCRFSLLSYPLSA